MSTIESKLQEIGLPLPAAPAPYASLTTAANAPSGRSSKRVKVTTGLLEEEPLWTSAC